LLELFRVAAPGRGHRGRRRPARTSGNHRRA
jgi:hypothetical protein